MIKRILLFPLFLLSLSVTTTYADALFVAGQQNSEKPDFLERVIEANDGDYQDPLGLTLGGTLKATAFNTVMYTAFSYWLYAFSPMLNTQVMNANLRFTMRDLLGTPKPKRGDADYDQVADDTYIVDRAGEKVEERFTFTQKNIQYAELFAAQGACANLTYAAVRAATKELTGYDAASLVDNSIQAITAQTIGYYAEAYIPDVPRAERIFKQITNNQIASYVATDLTIAATMYAYKEMTGKKLRCPNLPIPSALRAVGIDERRIGSRIYVVTEYALRTMVMDKLCGVPAA